MHTTKSHQHYSEGMVKKEELIEIVVLEVITTYL